jgi:hypothetical protein
MGEKDDLFMIIENSVILQMKAKIICEVRNGKTVTKKMCWILMHVYIDVFKYWIRPHEHGPVRAIRTSPTGFPVPSDSVNKHNCAFGTTHAFYDVAREMGLGLEKF